MLLLKTCREEICLLDFEGSDIRNSAFFYASFGATDEKYLLFG
jgi:hypothetical protein